MNRVLGPEHGGGKFFKKFGGSYFITQLLPRINCEQNEMIMNIDRIMKRDITPRTKASPRIMV
jgi:hypothetical protein